jgi:tRNA threonylcarbamoyladenosine biosynthesis protein TsaB
MLTLAVDTTADYGSIALADEQGCREEVLLHAPQGFSHVLFGEIAALLARNCVALRDIDLFAGASGPGSFTGVRVGLSAVKGLAEVLGKRVAAVSSLEALAEFGTGHLRASVINAHRGEIYGAVYDSAGKQVVPEVVAPFPKFLTLLPAEPVEWIQVPLAIAGMIARVAIRRGGAVDPAAIEANYVRRSDAELLFRPVAGQSKSPR